MCLPYSYVSTRAWLSMKDLVCPSPWRKPIKCPFAWINPWICSGGFHRMQGALLPLLYLRSLSPLFSSLAYVPASSCLLSFNESLLLPLCWLFFCWKICESQRSNYVRIRICSKHLLRGCGVTTFSLEFFWIRDSMQATCQKSQKQRPSMISFLSDELMFILEDPTRSHHF